MLKEAIRVILTGICTFIEADVGDNNRPLTAVFANASQHEPAHHVSLIVSDDDYLLETDLRSELLYSEMGRPYTVVLLDGKSIALAGVLDKKLVLARPSLSKVADDENRPTNMVELESVEWIPSLGRSWPRMFPMRRARRMRREFFSASIDPRLVSSFMELPKGRLASHWVSGDIWAFRPRNWTRTLYKTAMAQEVRFEADLSGDVVHFDLCDLQARQHCGYVRITRRNSSARKKPIEVVIANVPDADRLPGSIVFCGECGVSECEDPDDPFPCTCVDHHYSNYYHAFKSNMPSRPSLPRRLASGTPLVPTAMKVGGGNCPPSGYP